MKQLIFIIISLMMLSTNVLAAPIKVGNINDIYVANSLYLGHSLTGSSNLVDCETSQIAANCDFEQTFQSGTYISNTTLETIATSNFSTSVKSPEKSDAYIDLAFEGYDIYNGAGHDLVLFFIGNDTSFGLDVFDKNDNELSSGIYNITADNTVFDDDGYWICVDADGPDCTSGFPLSAVFIDLGESVAGDIAVGNIRISLGEGFNGKASSNFSLAGGFHTEATVVPLPLSGVLFSSGLALLGLIGRRKNI